MTSARKLLEVLNGLLGKANLRIDSLTAERRHDRRLEAVRADGGFEGAVYPVPSGFASSRHAGILEKLPAYQKRFETFKDPAANDVRYAYGNDYFESIDAEVLYTIVRSRRPRRIVEIGCGNSTRVIRQAILDEELETRHRCIDPCPRVEITRLADEVREECIELVDPDSVVGDLEAGDILFVDTSHEVFAANDVAHIFGRLLPRLGAGVLVHIHDIFTPYEYPASFVMGPARQWGEQYLVQMMLENEHRWEVLWPGYYLQKTLPGFETHFPRMGNCFAQSLWLVTA